MTNIHGNSNVGKDLTLHMKRIWFKPCKFGPWAIFQDVAFQHCIFCNVSRLKNTNKEEENWGQGLARFFFCCLFWVLFFVCFLKSCSCSVVSACDSLDCSLPGSSVHGIFQARIPEWVAISFSRGSSWPRGQARISHISCIVGRCFTTVPPLYWTLFPHTLSPFLHAPFSILSTSTHPLAQALSHSLFSTHLG